MPIIDTSQLGSLSPGENLQVYCGLDCCVTAEVLGELKSLTNQSPAIYNFERALQAPYLEIMNRGFAVDQMARLGATAALRRRIDGLQANLDQLAGAVWGRGLNPRSPAQLKDFFYQHMKLPEVWISQKGQRKLSTNREALERLETYLYARPFTASILAIRDLAKQLEVFETEIDSDGRYRTSYNIAGTECIAGDSLIWTKSGLRTIREIYQSPHNCAVWNGSVFVDPVRKVKYENREGFKFELEGGYTIKCSSNHELLTSRGWLQAKDIKSSDYAEINVGLIPLYGQHALPRDTPAFTLMTEDMCEFFGIWLADGSLNCNSEHYRCRISNTDEIVQERFKYLARTLFNVEVGHYANGEMSFSSKRFCTWFRDIGLPADSGLGTASIKQIPSILLRGKSNLLRALLRGLTLDSHQTEKGVMFGTQSRVMQDQIQQILLLLGIRSVKLQMGDSIKLNVPRSYCGRFLSLVGFVQPNKAESLARLLNQRSQWHEPDNFGIRKLVPIKEISNWIGDVYDLAMPESSPPHYVAQGFTVHNTGRPSSSSNAFGTGGNAQNIAPALRYVFVADPGFRLGQIDLEQVEARDVGFFIGCLFNDWNFLDACESGDLHTNNAKRIWPELPWTGDKRADRQLADQNFYRDFSYRDMAKRGSHLSNYMGTAWTASRALKVPNAMMEEFQARYCRGRAVDRQRNLPAISPAFPGIPRYWQWIATELQTRGWLETPFGRRRHFFGRHEDDTTIREAIAFLPQSTTADRMNLGLWRVWHAMPQVQLLAQTYDSITFQYREELDEDEVIAQALELIRVELIGPNGRKYVVPGEAKVGWNWGYQVTEQDQARVRAEGKKIPRLNLDGLAKWIPGQRDTRTRAIPFTRSNGK